MAQWIASNRMVCVWLAALVGCLAWQARYELTPGPALAPPVRQEPSALLAQAPGRSLVVMALHPHCPCSRASLADLSEVQRQSGDSVDIRILGVVPRGVFDPDAWLAGPVLDAARTIAGAAIIRDDDGALALSLGMLTSGHVVAFDAEGRTVFSGGITASRAQAGPNPGLRQLLGTLLGPAAPTPSVAGPVFGCPLFTPETCTDGCGDIAS